MLTEGPAIVQYLADQVPQKHLSQPTALWLSPAELADLSLAQKSTRTTAFFNPAVPAEMKDIARATCSAA